MVRRALDPASRKLWKTMWKNLWKTHEVHVKTITSLISSS